MGCAMSASPKVQARAVADDEAGLRLDRWFRRHHPNLTQGALQKMLRGAEWTLAFVNSAGQMVATLTRVFGAEHLVR